MDVEKVKGVGTALAEKLRRIGITTAEELVNYFPRDYRDESQLTKLGHAQMGHLTAKVTFSSIVQRRSRKGMTIVEAIASDETGSVKVIWFKQPYRARQIAKGQFYMSGELAYKMGRVNVVSPMLELVDENPLHTGRIVPIYRESAGLSSKQFRRILDSALASIKWDKTLPAWLISEHKLLSRAEAYRQIHFPDSQARLDEAKRRLGFEELLGFMVGSALNKQEFELEKASPMPFDVKLAQEFVAKLPFALTDAQRKVVWQMYQDMAKSTPANRLIEGDVGSGKTVVAAMAALQALEHGFQVAFMAPTELLARQQAESLQKLMDQVGKGSQVGLLVGGLDAKAKKRAQEAIAAGKIGLIVGTHALIQDTVKIPKLGLVVVDEQHRFGVEQRKKLESKASLVPHSFYLTATPIPRSLALTLYGEMDVSILDQKPAGRQPVNTEIISAAGFTEILRKVGAFVSRGEQVFVVCPLISKADNLADLTAAENMHAYLQKTLPSLKFGLLHGKQKAALKEEVMADFIAKKTDVLVATTVIEVGVDVPNANLMVIMGAEKFGLAQLHQLRGRVGRGQQAAECLLAISDDEAPTNRLKVMTQTNDGFKLAEYDLKLRGPGAIYGTLQHGALDLKIAKLTDVKLISETRLAAQKLLQKEDIKNWPHLLERSELLRSITYLN